LFGLKGRTYSRIIGDPADSICPWTITIRSKPQTDPVGNEGSHLYKSRSLSHWISPARKELARRAMRLEIKNSCVMVDSLQGY